MKLKLWCSCYQKMSTWIRIRTRTRTRRLLLFFMTILLMTLGRLLMLVDQTIISLNPFTNSNPNYLVLPQNGYTLTINTTFCKILDLPIDHSSIRRLIWKLSPLQCDKQNTHWTYVQDEYLVINETNLAESGLKFNQISCCFSTIHRVTQSVDNYTKEADHNARISDECIEIKNVTTLMSDEFVKVNCSATVTKSIWTWKTFSWSRILSGNAAYNYEQFHAFALALPRKNSKTMEKIAFWRKSDNFDTAGERPPTVLLVGQDSTSRLNFMRHMPKTRKILKKIGGIEFFGYTKVEEGTFSNLAAVLSGYCYDDLEKICFEKYARQDSCPYIWWDFDKLGYFTTEIEDGRTFNYKKAGFVSQPTDYYFRPFILGIQSKYGVAEAERCTGYEKSVKTVIDYITNVIKMSAKENVPLFMLGWPSNMAHDDVNGAQLTDEEFEDFIKFASKLKNTFLVFFSDHGYRHGTFKNTFSGWYEDKLPFMWFVLSQDLKNKYPNWVEKLHINSKKLTSPYDLHKTLVEILKVTSNYTVPDSKTRSGSKIKVSKEFGLSLISQEFPDSRKCADAGIPDVYCACSQLKSRGNVSTKESLNFKKAAQLAVEKINSFLPKICSKLELESIEGGEILDNVEKVEYEQYIVRFISKPGLFLFEAHLRYFAKNSTFVSNSKVLRTNGITKFHVSCIKDAHLELYCYCL